jgi:hypothetical protein
MLAAVMHAAFKTGHKVNCVHNECLKCALYICSSVH